ncbi:MAG: HK97 family phage prohead protease [Microlunatus sp.]
MTEVLTRAAAGAVIDHDLREIEILAVPYRSPTRVVDRDGTSYVEEFDAGAFGAAMADPRAVKVLRDHKIDRIVGSAIKVWEDGTGLRIRARLATTPLAEEAIALIALDALEASIGFLPPGPVAAGSAVRYDRSNPVELIEVSLVPFAAYKGTSVSLVRAGRLAELATATPALEALYGKPATVHTTSSVNPHDQRLAALLNEGEQWMRQDRARSAAAAADQVQADRALLATRDNLRMRLETVAYVEPRRQARLDALCTLRPAPVPFGADGMRYDTKKWTADDTEWTN